VKYTPKEAKFIEAKLRGKSNTEAAKYAGYSQRSAHITGSQLAKKPHIRNAILVTAEDLGITFEKAVKPIIEALEANKVISAVSAGDANGSTMDFVDVPDHSTRLKAASMALDLLGMKHGRKPDDKAKPEDLGRVLQSGDEIELQRAVFRKGDNSNEG